VLRTEMALKVLWCGLNFLNYIHAFNMVHRDLKPDNILLQDDRVYISDMGCVRYQEFSKSCMTHKNGTPPYRPPEMETRTYSKPSDIYCLGATIIHLLCRKIPKTNSSTVSKEPNQWKKLLDSSGGTGGTGATYLNALLTQMIDASPTKRPTALQCLSNVGVFKGATIPPVLSCKSVPFMETYWNNAHINPQERADCISILIDFVKFYTQYTSVLSLIHAVHMFDDFNLLYKKHRSCDDIIYCMACMWLSSKYFDDHPFRVDVLVSATKKQYEIEEWLDIERDVLETINFMIYRRNPLAPLNGKSDFATLLLVLTSPLYPTGKVARRKSGRSALTSSTFEVID